MNIHSLIKNTLSPANVPVNMRTYTGAASEYITYFTEDYPELNADDAENITAFFVQLDVYATGNYNNLVDQVDDLMIAEGFERISYRDDPYSNEINMFHKVMSFSYQTPTI